ncbi:squalene/phytoene synthase family protein [Marivibrio halodurans]|uniref:Squalene/phytoene synthase family protein n=1 Tax=Marivibrio halodurans TaxID=2039722 RepID=A0A8J7RZR5_9PROT|nr:squalene/phytoene synthase family protein [Marivibrio halodurans]MBP5856048.1 squalene/phytoene synthase family protein [Marivibrio halodurans]
MSEDIVDPEAERAGDGPCARLVRRQDADRYMMAIAAPAVHRPALFALYAFNAEVAKTREVVSEAMLGEIRLQWWREALDGIEDGNPRRHEVVLPLAGAIDAMRPDRALFDALIDARARDLDEGTIETLEDFEDYARATNGGLIRLAQQMMGVPETAASRAAADALGIAHALVGQVRALPFHLAGKHMMLPRAVLEEAGATEDILFAAKPHEAIARAVAPLLERAEGHLREARALRRSVPGEATPAFLAAPIAAAHLKQLRRAGGDPFDGRLANPPVSRALRVAWAARTGRW